jgi:hypothetical protein
MLTNSDPIDQLITLLQNPRVQAFFENLVNTAVDKKIKESYKTPEFKGAVETVIVTSDLKVLPRLRNVEKTTGIYQFDDFEEHEPTLPEQIIELKTKVETLESNHITPDTMKAEIPVHKETTLEQKVSILVDKLKNKRKSWSGKISMDHGELKEFVNTELPEELRGTDKNDRRLIDRIIKKAREMYPNLIEISKSKNGRHENSICLKQTYQSNGAVRIPLFLSGELL